MKPQKKITIKPFLNQNLIPECSDSSGKNLYPLYIQITYDRKNTQIRSKYGMYYETLNDPGLFNLIAFESNILQKIIQFETSHSDSDYDLKGLKNKYTAYSTSVHYAVSEYLKVKLKAAIKRTNNELMHVLKFDGHKSNFDNMYKASQLLFPNLEEKITSEFKKEIEAFHLMHKLHPIGSGEYSFAALIDWKDNSFKSKFEASLNKELKQNKKQVSETLAIIDKIVAESLKSIEGA